MIPSYTSTVDRLFSVAFPSGVSYNMRVKCFLRNFTGFCQFVPHTPERHVNAPCTQEVFRRSATSPAILAAAGLYSSEEVARRVAIWPDSVQRFL